MLNPGWLTGVLAAEKREDLLRGVAIAGFNIQVHSKA